MFSRKAAAGVASAIAVVVLCTLLARNSSGSDAGVRAESGVGQGGKMTKLLREAAKLQADSLHAQAMARKYALKQQPGFAEMGSKNGQALYDIPSFTAERTQMHFPQAETGWLDMAAAGKIGDDVKTDDEQGNLTAIIDEWREKAYDEKKKAREDMAIAAKEENYYEYNITKGIATHKIYGPAPTVAAKQTDAAVKLAHNSKGPAPRLAAAKKTAPKLAVAGGKGVVLLARKKPVPHVIKGKFARKAAALPARVRAEEQIMEHAMAKQMAMARFKSEMKESMHLAQMKLAHQEMGMPVRRGPSAEMDVARTQSLGELGAGPEGDHLTAIKSAEIVDGNEPSSLISNNEDPASDTIDEVNVAVASQRADGYSNGDGAPVEDVAIPAP